jgi:nitrate reductase gamma subunit
MAAIGILTAIIGFFSFFLSTTSVVDPLQFPIVHSRVAAICGTFASLAIMMVGTQLAPH